MGKEERRAPRPPPGPAEGPGVKPGRPEEHLPPAFLPPATPLATAWPHSPRPRCVTCRQVLASDSAAGMLGSSEQNALRGHVGREAGCPRRCHTPKSRPWGGSCRGYRGGRAVSPRRPAQHREVPSPGSGDLTKRRSRPARCRPGADPAQPARLSPWHQCLLPGWGEARTVSQGLEGDSSLDQEDTHGPGNNLGTSLTH